MQPKRDILETKEKDEDDSSDSTGGSSKQRLKKYLKIGGALIGIGFMVKSMFFGSEEIPQAPKDDTEQIQTQEPKKENPAKEVIDLASVRKSSIAEREIEPFKANRDLNLKAPPPPDVSRPDVPPLPEFEFDIKKDEKKKNDSNDAKDLAMSSSKAPPQLPPDPPPQAPPPQITQSSNANQPQLNPDQVLAEKKEKAMFAFSEGDGGNNGNQKKINSGDQNDFVIYDKSKLVEKKAQKKDDDKTKVTQVADLGNTVLQGKIVDVVLETAINSELPGTIRGIVSRDVYAESGTKVMIPKGTRVYGAYSSAVKRGQSRLNVTWNRLIRPDGVSVSVVASAADQFGRIGIEGDVDNRYSEIFSNSLLLNFVNLGTALAVERLSTSAGTQTTQVVNSNGSVATTTNPLNLAANTVIQNTSDIVKQLTDGAMTLSPIVTLPQGTRLKVVVNQDITLPDYKKQSI